MIKSIKILILLLIFSLPLSAQYKRVITGTVLDNQNEALIGATIQIKDTNDGTLTDLDGKFTLTLTNPDYKILKVMYIGFITQEVDISNGKSDYTIILEEDNKQLDEVIVVAYGTYKKQSLMGSVSSVSASSSKSNEKKTSSTWKRSGMKDNSIRLEVGANDYIPLEAAQMTVQVDGFRVRVLLDCFFYNNKGNGLEGTFKLKLPAEATPYYMAFGETSYIDEDKEDKEREKQIPFSNLSFDKFNMSYQNAIRDKDRYWRNVKEARIVSKQKAAKAYEQTVSGQIDPALMEWGGADMFSCKVYPLFNNTLHRIVIGYDLNMTEALDFREYVLGVPQVEKDLKLDIVMHSTTDMPVSISASENALKEKSADRVYYSISNPKEKDFTIRYNTVEPVLLIQNEDPKDSFLEESLNIPYFASTCRVNVPEVLQENLPEDAVFILDTSISSNPDKFNVWLTLIDKILDQNKDIIKRFAVLSFSIDGKWYANHFQKNNYYNKERFMEYANTLALEGATDLAQAIKEASNPSWLKQGKNKPKHIFLMSDGDCNWGETNMHQFSNLIFEGDRIHTYKTGISGTNAAVLNYLSRQTNGFSFTVTGEEEAGLTARSFRYKPWNIEKIEMEGIEDFLISGNPIQLYNNQKLIFTGRNIPQGNISIVINNGIEKRELNFASNKVIQSSLVSRIYGQIASSYLDNLGFVAEDAAINYSTYYRVPGLHTSLLMLESDWDYQRFGISDYDAKDYVEDNLITTLVTKLEKPVIANDPKAQFVDWLDKLSESDIRLEQSDELRDYLQSIPSEKFSLNKESKRFRLYLAEEQTSDEQEILADEDLRFDRLYSLAKKRVSTFGQPAALRLLSSVVERNAADFQVIHDVAFISSYWNMNEDTYYLMKRLIDMRQEEAISYLGAADALASTPNNIDLALLYYYISLGANWDSSYGNFQDIAAIKCRKYLKKLSTLPTMNITDNTKKFITYLDTLTKGVLEYDDYTNSDEADILIITNWNMRDTYIDPYITEPNGEVCYYGNSQTASGGIVSDDVWRGYGPVIYLLRKAPPGDYKVELDYYSDSGPRTASKSKTFMEIYKNWGRKNEKLTRKIIDLSKFSSDYQSDEEEETRKTVLTFKIR